MSRLTSILHKLGTATIDGASYTYDNAGNRKTRTDKRLNTTLTYTYENIYQLQLAKQGSTTKETYSYDAVGNRLSSLGVSPYVYNSSNELTSLPNVGYTYDNNGNTKTKTDTTGITTYTWDFENRLSSVALPGSGGTVSFKYDPFGRRVQKSSASGTTNYFYDGANLLEEVDQSGIVLTRYTQTSSLDEPLAELRSGTTSYYDADGIGSATSLSSTAGALANTYTVVRIYDAFGKVTASTGTLTNPVLYTGREFDAETGIYFYRDRYYDQNVGRFLSEDPAGFEGGRTFYSYVRNNPALLIDPRGLAPEKKCECQGNSGGVITAAKCCQKSLPIPSTANPNPYGPCDSFTYINAAYMYRNGGNSAWGQIVRGCLLCAYQYGTSPSAAHLFCYGSANQRDSHWWDPLVFPFASSNWGLGRAVVAAGISGVVQTVQYVKNNGNRPFVCLDGVQ